MSSAAKKDKRSMATLANPFNVKARVRRRSLGMGGDGGRSFVDRRLGENVEDMSREEKLLARFQRQQVRQANRRKKRKFNIDEDTGEYDEEGGGGDDDDGALLTHKGKPLSLSDKLMDDGFDLHSDEEELIGSRAFVNAANFGAGGTPGQRTHKEIMEEVIGKSKAFREMRRVEKEDMEAEREKLDTAMEMIMKMKTKGKEGEKEGGGGGAGAGAGAGVGAGAGAGGGGHPPLPADDYDDILGMLKKDARTAQAADKVKTPEERAAANARKLKRLDREQKARMGATADDDDTDEEEEDEHWEFDTPAPDQDKGKDGKTDKKKNKDKKDSKKDAKKAKRKEQATEATMKRYLSLVTQIGAWTPDADTPLDAVEAQTQALFDVTVDRPVQACAVWRSVLSNMRSECSSSSSEEGGRHWPTVGQLLQLKTCLSLFPVTDFRHQVIAPAMLTMSQWLSQWPVRTVSDVVTGLGVCLLMLDATSKSCRVVPEVVSFLTAVLSLCGPAIPHTSSTLPVAWRTPLYADLHSSFAADITAYAKSHRKASSLPRLPLFTTLHGGDSPAPAPAVVAAGVVGTVCTAVDAVMKALHSVDAASELAAPLVRALGKAVASTTDGPLKLSLLQTQVTAQRAKKDCETRRGHLQLQTAARRIEPIKDFVPSFQMGFDPDRAETTKEAVRRLKRRVTREKKAAARDLKHEAVAITRNRQEARNEREVEREAKFKEVLGFLEHQQATFKEMVGKGMTHGGGRGGTKM